MYDIIEFENLLFFVRPQLNDESRMLLAKLHSEDRFWRTVFMVPAAPLSGGQKA